MSVPKPLVFGEAASAAQRAGEGGVVPLLPTVRATAALAVFERLNLPVPWRPPKVAASSVPNLIRPVPLESSVRCLQGQAVAQQQSAGVNGGHAAEGVRGPEGECTLLILLRLPLPLITPAIEMPSDWVSKKYGREAGSNGDGPAGEAYFREVAAVASPAPAVPVKLSGLVPTPNSPSPSMFSVPVLICAPPAYVLPLNAYVVPVKACV